MDTSLHYLIMIVHSLFQKQVLAELSPLGLTAGQPKVLDYLGRHDGSVQKEIAVGCQIDPATLTGLLNRMEDQGMTELGWARQKEVMAAFKKCENKLLSDLNPLQQKELTRTLLQFCKKMTDFEVLQ